MVQFAREIGAQIVAEGVETSAELTAVTRLGMTSGQGYFLGRPSLHPADWEAWKEARISGTLQQAVAYHQTLPASPTSAPPLTRRTFWAEAAAAAAATQPAPAVGRSA